MKISKFVGPLNFIVVMHYLQVMAKLFAYLFCFPILVAAVATEWLYAAIFLGIALVCYGLSFLQPRGSVETLELREALVVTALGYLLFAFVGSLSFLPVAPFEDAFFEALSAITTTGLSVLSIEELPASLLFFRSYAQWLGGLGVVVLTLTILNNSGRAASKLYSSEGGRENIRGNLTFNYKSHNDDLCEFNSDRVCALHLSRYALV